MHTATRGAREPSFLPLVLSAATDAVGALADPPVLARAQLVRRRAAAADAAAEDCWTALLAGCHMPARRVLPGKLHELTEATSLYLGTRCWYGAGSPHRGRVTGAEARIADAVRDGDGAEFAEAFAGYDQAVATAMASVRSRTSSPA